MRACSKCEGCKKQPCKQCKNCVNPKLKRKCLKRVCKIQLTLKNKINEEKNDSEIQEQKTSKNQGTKEEP